MNLRVQLFAAARQAAGRDVLEVELPPGATIAQLRSRLAAECPALSSLAGLVLFAVNAEYARDTDVIPAGAEVACIPPVSGG